MIMWRIMYWLAFIIEGGFEEGQVPLRGCAMAGHEVARCMLGLMDAELKNVERAVKHWTIAASAGHYNAMHHLRLCFEKGLVGRESIDSTLAA